jgi:sigma-B regulation protein RsbU (phosphoserine phosphatase)
MLTEQGYKVRSVINGPMALMATRAAPPDLIQLDINMPEMSGYQVCETLKADVDEQVRDIPIIFISALDEVQDKVKAFTVGGVDYVTKPFQLEEVLARVETHLALRRLQRELQEGKQRLEHELALAGRVQASFLPEIPHVPGWQLALTLRPARQTSGDFYDVCLLPNGQLGILVADVVDKGVCAALYMVLSWILIRSYAKAHPAQPELVLAAANQHILTDTQANQFVTVFYGILDPATGTLVYCNAGHCPPYLVGSQRDAQKLIRTGMPLGIIQDGSWEQHTVQLDPGDVLVLYSDGITEAQDASGTLYGEERLLASVQANLGSGAQDIQDAIIRDVDQFAGGKRHAQFDDMTLVVIARDALQGSFQ